MRVPEDSHKGESRGAWEAAEFPKVYEPGLIEPRWAEVWVEQELFRPDPKASGEVFSIVIPPPNVTGYIHIGHMLEHTQIDVLTRWHRMRGKNTLWLPGLHDPGIEKTVVADRELRSEGRTRNAVRREERRRRKVEGER